MNGGVGSPWSQDNIDSLKEFFQKTEEDAVHGFLCDFFELLLIFRKTISETKTCHLFLVILRATKEFIETYGNFKPTGELIIDSDLIGDVLDYLRSESLARLNSS